MVEGQAPRRSAVRLRTACAVLGLLLAGSASAESQCAAWPGEPRPLPGVHDTDPLRARWAALRIRELDAAARALEARDPARARALWQHAACIAPADGELARRASARIPAVAVHRPPIERGDTMPEASDAWASLSAPIAAVGRAPAHARRAAPAQSAAPADSAVAKLVDETAALVRAARFDDALASAERARGEAASLAPSARAALEVWAATAELALGRDAAARASLGRALDAEPDLRLDASTSPKVRRALEAVRAERRQ